MAENPVLVCAAADLPPGNVKSFDVGGELVAVYNIDGTFYACISARSTCRAGKPCESPASPISRRSGPR